MRVTNLLVEVQSPCEYRESVSNGRIVDAAPIEGILG